MNNVWVADFDFTYDGLVARHSVTFPDCVEVVANRFANAWFEESLIEAGAVTWECGCCVSGASDPLFVFLGWDMRLEVRP